MLSLEHCYLTNVKNWLNCHQKKIPKKTSKKEKARVSYKLTLQPIDVHVLDLRCASTPACSGSSGEVRVGLFIVNIARSVPTHSTHPQWVFKC